MSNIPVPTPRPALSADDFETHVPGTILPSASRAVAAHNSSEFKNHNHAGIRLFVTTTAGAGNVTVKVQGKDPISGAWVDLTGATTAALSGTSTTALTVYPGLTAAANDKIDHHLGLTWRVVATVAVGDLTFSVAGEYLC